MVDFIIPALRRKGSSRMLRGPVVRVGINIYRAYHRGALCPHDHPTLKQAGACSLAWCPGVCPHDAPGRRAYPWDEGGES